MYKFMQSEKWMWPAVDCGLVKVALLSPWNLDLFSWKLSSWWRLSTDGWRNCPRFSWNCCSAWILSSFIYLLSQKKILLLLHRLIEMHPPLLSLAFYSCFEAPYLQIQQYQQYAPSFIAWFIDIPYLQLTVRVLLLHVSNFSWLISFCSYCMSSRISLIAASPCIISFLLLLELSHYCSFFWLLLLEFLSPHASPDDLSIFCSYWRPPRVPCLQPPLTHQYSAPVGGPSRILLYLLPFLLLWEAHKYLPYCSIPWLISF